jgi:hypothetical protein
MDGYRVREVMPTDVFDEPYGNARVIMDMITTSSRSRRRLVELCRSSFTIQITTADKSEIVGPLPNMQGKHRTDLQRHKTLFTIMYGPG